MAGAAGPRQRLKVKRVLEVSDGDPRRRCWTGQPLCTEKDAFLDLDLQLTQHPADLLYAVNLREVAGPR